MNRHQVLTGAANHGDNCYATGSVEGVHFTAYGAGCDVVILASDFQRVQIIPGVTHGNIQVSCVDCSTDTGKIAASYGRKVCIFEPAPLIHLDSSHKLDYQWYQTGIIEADCEVNILSWNQEGTKLLTGGDQIQMWIPTPESQPDADPTHTVSFFIDGQSASDPSGAGEIDEGLGEEGVPHWMCVWHCRTANTTYHLQFSTDGLLFASAGRNDRMVKVWYENKKVNTPMMRSDSVSPKKEEINYSFVYIAHPRAITGFSWRRTSKYMPRGSVANMLITSCKDNICRIWCETIMPEDGLVDLQQLEPQTASNPMFHTHRHKNRFMQRLHHIRQVMHKRKRSSNSGFTQGTSAQHPPLPSDQSIHDFHKFGVHPNSVAPGFHFHLAASINPETDIPLIPAMNNDTNNVSFVVHWLNNKEFHFTLESEKLIDEVCRSRGVSEEPVSDLGSPSDHILKEPEEMSIGNRGETMSSKPPEMLSFASKKKLLQRTRDVMSTESERSTASYAPSTTSSIGTLGTNVSSFRKPIDPLDLRIEELLRDWHQSADMLFSVHPLDGSYLVWLVDWLDEYQPGSFRQAQISFSSRIPHALPIGDAITMSPNLMLYCNYGRIDLKATLKESERKEYASDGDKSEASLKYTANAMGKSSPGQSDNTFMQNALMLSKHSDGSLNLWQISFADGSKFSTVLSLAHASRACGHRFHTNSAACHPVLPLILTTSHHNVPSEPYSSSSSSNHASNHSSTHTSPNKSPHTYASLLGFSSSTPPQQTHSPVSENRGFMSELILWRVDPVGPLSKSGGVTELARVDSPNAAAFSNVAWVPTLLPSSTLGSMSNSPSALFIASDGASLRMYQAVIDARTLLHESTAKRKVEINMTRTSSDSSSGWMQYTPTVISMNKDSLDVVSEQSTARPGCVIQLDMISGAKQDWQGIHFIHIFQEQLITGQRSGNYDLKGQTNVEALVDLQHLSIFEEHFFLVVIEKMDNGGCVLHMWKIVISSHDQEETVHFSPDVVYSQEFDANEPRDPYSDDEIPRRPNMSEPQQSQGSKISIESIKVCTQVLELPEGISIVTATVAAGHLSSSSIYPACFAPYLLSTACTDGRVRFWKCKTTREQETTKYDWVEWQMMIQTEEDTSAIKIPGKPIAVSCAYSGRVAVAYRMGGVRTSAEKPEDKFVNLCVSIYECESTGGSEWTLEDTIELKNINVSYPQVSIDMSYLSDLMDHLQDRSHTLVSPTGAGPSIVKSVVPSPSTLKSIKKSLTEIELNKKKNVIKQRHVVQLDWVSTEDGSHILTVAVGSKIILYGAVSGELAHASSQRNDKTVKSQTRRGILQKSKSMTVQHIVEEIRWMRIRSIDLSTADGLAPLPMHVSWVRDGILVVGMDNEMHVYTQWRGPGDVIDPSHCVSTDAAKTDNFDDKRTLTDLSLQHVSSASNLIAKGFKLSPSASMLKMTSSMSNMSMFMDKKFDKDKRKDSKASASKADITKSDSVSSLQTLMFDCGMFEAARLANPVLPQYHPKQLIELLGFGKIRRVKAILAHLVRCISGKDNMQAMFTDDGAQIRARSMSRGSASQVPNVLESGNPDYIEIHSIPPLPLYALLAADENPIFGVKESAKSPTAPAAQTDYSTLFANNNSESDDVDGDVDDIFYNMDDSGSSPNLANERRRKMSQSSSNPNYFGPSQAGLLAKHLTHTHLPGLSSLDQMYLLALADTVANTKLDFSEKLAPDMAVKQVLKREEGITGPAGTEHIDDCGLRYHLAARHHVYLSNTLSIRQRARLQMTGLSPAYFVWAFHSEAEEELLNVLPSMQKNEPTWTELRQFGVGWWLRNINTLRRTIEKLVLRDGIKYNLHGGFDKVAKAAFQAKKDPLDAAVFYLAMKKKNVLWGLFRSVSDTKMENFFKNQFTEERWRKAALKNAFALLGRQRFHHAAAFFLLAGAVRDAIEVCLNKLDDLQLAIVIARLYGSEFDDQMPQSVKRILYEECLGCDQYGGDYDSANSHPDPFIRSMAYWMLHDYSASLGTLLESSTEGYPQAQKTKSSKDAAADSHMDLYSSTPSVFNFYNYLRTHPLIVRQQLASSKADKGTCQSVLLSGFSYGSTVATGDKNITCVDKITPVERRLYFTTAHAHFKSGCPMLALEVLSKLPEVIDLENDITKSHSSDNIGSALIQTGTLDSKDETVKQSKAKSSQLDWSQPLMNGGINSNDWSKPVSSGFGSGSNGFDWSQPVTKVEDDELKLDWSDDNEDTLSADEDTKSDNEAEVKETKADQKESEPEQKTKTETPATTVKNKVGDIMAQQLKFVACLKVMMEELSTLATGFEVDGGQLRFQLYIWLEKEVEVLRQLTNYGKDMEPLSRASSETQSGDANLRGDPHHSLTIDPTSKPTLHEVILAEKLDFENKLGRASRRKQWLKAHQQLLRTLLGYCVLHGASGGGLSSVRMELILLLQELQQEKTQQQLLSPLPFPTSLPLLSASVASSKTVIADPIRHLQSLSQDLLHSVIEFRSPPRLSGPLPRVFTLRNLSAALSACIYQSLCDSDNFVVAISDHVDFGMEGFTSTNVVYKDSYLMAGAQRQRKTSSISEDVPNSLPAKWPGVSSLRGLLAREKDDDSPRLTILLCESLVAVYMSLLIYALTTYDSNILYRLMAHTFKPTMWPALFGGGLKKLIRVMTSSSDQSYAQRATPPDDISRQRMKLHMKVMGPSGSPGRLKEDKPTYREKFIPPDLSMITYFMTKPYENPNDVGVDYDSAQSADSSEDEDEEEANIIKVTDVGMHEHIDANSYSWCLMRYVVVHQARKSMLQFLPQIGIELPELPVSSPLVQSVLKTLETWEELLHARLNLFSGPPLDYIPGCYPDATSGQLANKYRALLEPGNTPFVSSHASALPAKRLWHYLVKQESLQHIFIKYVFKRRTPHQTTDETLKTEAVDGFHAPVDEPMKIIHKEQDVISAFCINQANLHCIAVATTKEVVEMDVTHLLSPPSWLEDETEYDIECIKKPSSSTEPEEFLLVQVPQDRLMMGGVNLPPTAPGVMPLPGNQNFSGHTGRGAGVVKGLTIPGLSNPSSSLYIVDRSKRILRRGYHDAAKMLSLKSKLTKRKSEDVRKMSAHPHLPYYLTGAQDGSVRLWEWGHGQNIAVARQPGSFPKVTKVLFNAQGNKFGVTDGEGSLCLWQVGLGVSMSKPYLNLRCHNKSTNDFTFVGSSSLLATAGHASESKNVCLWDTLMPQKSALVQAFHCHHDGSPAVLYAPQHQVLISGGKRGDVCLFDVRQRQIRHTFQAHDAAIRCMSLDPAEQYFVTGAADGDVKVWGLNVHNLVYSFPGEHVKGSLFRNVGTGVSQVYVSPDGHLFSCGGDGSLKVRTLPQQTPYVQDYASTLASPIT